MKADKHGKPDFTNLQQTDLVPDRHTMKFGENPPCSQCGVAVSAVCNHECKPSYKELVAEVESLESKVASWKRICNATAMKQVELRTALENLLNVQNGCPYSKYEEEWEAAMKEAEKLIYGDKAT